MRACDIANLVGRYDARMRVRIVLWLGCVAVIAGATPPTFLLERGDRKDWAQFVDAAFVVRTPYGAARVRSGAVESMAVDAGGAATVVTRFDRVKGRLQAPLRVRVGDSDVALRAGPWRLQRAAKRGSERERPWRIHLRDGTRVRVRPSDAALRFRTEYGVLRFRLRDLRSLRRTDSSFVLKTSDSTFRGQLETGKWTLDTPLGQLVVAREDIQSLSRTPDWTPGLVLGKGAVVLASSVRPHAVWVLVASTDGLTWPEAAALARRQGGHLVTVRSAADCKALVEFAAPHGTRAWIGLQDAEQEGDWRWHSGADSKFRAWDPGEPNDAGGEDYAELYLEGRRAGRWNDTEAGRRITLSIFELPR